MEAGNGQDNTKDRSNKQQIWDTLLPCPSTAIVTFAGVVVCWGSWLVVGSKMDLVVSLKYLRYGRRIRWICFETVLHVKCRKVYFQQIGVREARGSNKRRAQRQKCASIFFCTHPAW